MMTLHLLCVGKLKERYLAEACREYEKRLGAFCRFRLTEVSEYRLPDNPSPGEIETALKREGEELLSKLPRDALVIPMCIEGKALSSQELAGELSGAALRGTSQLCAVIGGSWGLSEEVKVAGGLRLSMSRMTFPHQLARVMVLEQFYRAFSINAGGKYHK